MIKEPFCKCTEVNFERVGYTFEIFFKGVLPLIDSNLIARLKVVKALGSSYKCPTLLGPLRPLQSSPMKRSLLPILDLNLHSFSAVNLSQLALATTKTLQNKMIEKECLT